MSDNSDRTKTDPPPTNAALHAKLDRLEKKLDRLSERRDPDRLLTREEAAERLQISLRKLDTLAHADELPALRIGRCVRFAPDAVDAFVRRCAEGVRR